MLLSQTCQSCAEAFLRLFYPEHCGSCSGFLDLDETILCRNCSSKVKGLRYSVEDMLTDERHAGLDHVWSLYRYEEPLKGILTAIKFSGQRRLLRFFRGPLADVTALLQSESGYDGIVPIPLDRKRFLEREYNQSELIATLIEKTYVQKARRTKLQGRLLRKPFASQPQSQLHRSQRLVNLYGAFEVRSRESLQGKSFLLVDDILTTGATAQEAARALKSRGAKRVDMLTLARTERSR